MTGNTRQKGSKAEDIAAEYLASRGFRIIERNFTVRGGEIDIIAIENGVYVFVEVKSSMVPGFDPIEQVTRRKIRFLKRAAELYLMKHGLIDRVECRFDVVTVRFGSGGRTEVRHYRDAFNY